MNKRLFYICITSLLMPFLSFAYVGSNDKITSEKVTPTILISIDGFANDYLEKYKPKNLLKLANQGVRAKALRSVFPSKTFPNHISIVTGNYPSTHGVIHNSFYNRALQKNYKLGRGKEDFNWLKSTPLWSVAEKNNVKTAIYFWPESEVNSKYFKPSYVKPYKHNTPNATRFNQIVEWLKLPENERPSLVLGYFSTIDSIGHDHGTASVELKKAIAQFDQLLGQFLERLNTELDTGVNIVLVSDHGMTNISPKTIHYEHLFEDVDNARVVDGQTQLFVYLPNSEMLNEESIANRIKSKLTPQEQAKVNVYGFDNYPKHWHFNARSPVMPNIVIEALPPYVFGKKKTALPPYDSGKQKKLGNATHGYDPRFTSQLNAIFIANGPSFKKQLTIEPIENIHIFPMLLSLFDIEPPLNIDANKEVLLHIIQ